MPAPDAYNSLMYLYDRTMPTLVENLALDEALLLEAEAGGAEVLRFWQWDELGVVLGAGGRLADEVNEDACRADGVPIVRRSSGGGAVLLGPGCLLFSLILRFERDPALADLHASYRFILGRIAGRLQMHAPGISFEGTSDLTLDGRKFSGNAQQRKRTHLLHHGTLLHAFDAAPLERYLKPPPRQPEYRRGRSHAEFVTNVPVEVDTLKSALSDAWQARASMELAPLERMKELAMQKYTHAEWTRRR